MGWPKGWTRQDIGSFPGATDGKQHIWIDHGNIQSYAAVDVPVKIISILLAVVDEQPETAMHPAWMITWTESELGWGCSPDGVSLHLGQEESVVYVATHWALEKELNDAKGGGVPHDYDRPDDLGRQVLVSTGLFSKIWRRQAENGIHIGNHEVANRKQAKELK